MNWLQRLILTGAIVGRQIYQVIKGTPPAPPAPPPAPKSAEAEARDRELARRELAKEFHHDPDRPFPDA